MKTVSDFVKEPGIIVNHRMYYPHVVAVNRTITHTRTRLKLLGIPLFHFQFSSPEYGDTPAVAWVAGGTTAYGLLFAHGMLLGIADVTLISRNNPTVCSPSRKYSSACHQS